MNRTYLLSIDGGGLRGIIPAIALMKLEQTTGRLARDIFSFVAGTSTGAIITSAIVAGVPASRIRDLYINRADEIFRQSWLNLPRRILRGSMYSTQTLHDVLADTLGPASTWTLNQSPIDLLITAKRVADGMPWYFVRDKPTNSGVTGRLSLVDCVTASAAAPTYFHPWTIPSVGELVDGGVGVAGNPVYQAVVEALYYGGYQRERTTIVSMGTGRFIAEKHPMWIWPWFEWLLGELLRSPGEQQTEIVQRHFSEIPFYRIDPVLERNIQIDDVKRIPELVDIGERLAERIDWNAILADAPTEFSVGKQTTLYYQYRRPI